MPRFVTSENNNFRNEVMTKSNTKSITSLGGIDQEANEKENPNNNRLLFT